MWLIPAAASGDGMSRPWGSRGAKATSVSTLGVDRVGVPEAAGDPGMDDPLLRLRLAAYPD
jgi:hypothetical protein